MPRTFYRITMYELWDVETGNIVGEYASEAAALAVVARALDADGADVASCLALVRRSPSGDSQLVAEAGELVRRAAQDTQRRPAPKRSQLVDAS